MNESQKLFGPPSRGAKHKIQSVMTDEVQSFIAQSPFLVMATSNKQGFCDASPKGGAAGFVKILDKKHLIIPDIAGNNLFQTYENIETNPNVGLVFFIPGENKTVRINGSAQVIRNGEEVFDSLVVKVFAKDRNTRLIQALVVQVMESYSHCPRSITFANLWDSVVIRENRKIFPQSKVGRWYRSLLSKIKK